MTRFLATASIALVLSVGASFATPPDAVMAGGTSTIGHDGLDQLTVTDLTRVAGGARRHSCRTDSVAGAVLTAAGQALGSPFLTAVGMHLTFRSMTICV